MTKSTKHFFSLIMVTFIGTIIFCIFYKPCKKGYQFLYEFTEHIDINNLKVQYMNNNEYFQHTTSEIKDLQNEADLVVKVKCLNNRQLYMNSVKSPVIIEEIYKEDNNSSKDKTIYIYEPTSISCHAYVSVNCMGGYQLMETGKEYVMFLKKLDKVDGYEYRLDEDICYIPVSTIYAKYSCKDDYIDISTFDMNKLKDGDYIYMDVKNQPIISYDKSVIDQYKTNWMTVKLW